MKFRWRKGREEPSEVPTNPSEGLCQHCGGPLWVFNFGRQVEGDCGFSVESMTIRDANRSTERYVDIPADADGLAWLTKKGRVTGQCTTTGGQRYEI